MKKLLLTGCVALLGSSSVMAQSAPKGAPVAQTSTAAFVNMCENKKDVAAQNFCHGFGQGTYETYLVSRHPKTAKPFICVGEPPMTRQEHIDAFVKWSGSHPQYNQMSAADTILRYLGETYPCKK